MSSEVLKSQQSLLENLDYLAKPRLMVWSERHESSALLSESKAVSVNPLQLA